MKAIRFSVMTQTRRLLGLATATVVAVAVAACAHNGGSSAVSQSPNPSAPTATIATPSDGDAASQAASAAVAKYYATVDRLGQSPNVPLSDLSAVATSVQLSAEQNLLKTQRKAGDKQVGATKIAKLEVQAVNLDNSDPSAGKVPTVQVDVCWDVTHVDVVDATGKSIVGPSRPGTGWTRLTVANYHFTTDPNGGWRVATGQDLKKDPCTAS